MVRPMACGAGPDLRWPPPPCNGSCGIVGLLPHARPIELGHGREGRVGIRWVEVQPNRSTRTLAHDSHRVDVQKSTLRPSEQDALNVITIETKDPNADYGDEELVASHPNARRSDR
jgi:hypothetical protein